MFSDEVVLTHDDDTFFAYAVNERAIDKARDAIESVLRSEQRKGAIRVSHWDREPPGVAPDRSSPHVRPGRATAAGQRGGSCPTGHRC